MLVLVFSCLIGIWRQSERGECSRVERKKLKPTQPHKLTSSVDDASIPKRKLALFIMELNPQWSKNKVVGNPQDDGTAERMS